ncbi:energy transducer TonB [Mucilaginibacter sp. L196]|uniref:energy transducer TonB n=1 Tax=Mucilaginibacter sp. L196 TaxID=1641870 RepID=UPI00131C4736|nr:energy transducer TonB [Mucilaginibacter sp. L196]
MFFQAAKAQQDNPPGTIIYFRNKAGVPTDKEHVNDVIFIYPADSSSGKKLYPIKEFYIDGTVKLTGTSSTSSSMPVLEGSSIAYYPNGKLCSIENYNKKNQLLLIECRDSTGKILAENGNGKWLRFNIDHKVTEEGMVRDSLEDGEWKEIVNDSLKYVTIYNKGFVVSSTDPSKALGERVFTAVENEPQFADGGAAGFNAYLARTIKFPAVDRKNGTQGKVIVTFVVEKDGTLSNVKALRGPSNTIKDEAVRVVSLSPPWTPGMQNGQPARVQYTISFGFSLANN